MIGSFVCQAVVARAIFWLRQSAIVLLDIAFLTCKQTREASALRFFQSINASG